MNPSPEHDEKIANLVFADIYLCYLAKVEKKGRNQEELHQVIEWLTGFNSARLEKMADEKITLADFFSQADLHANADQITGTICGYRIETITNPLTQNVRRLDKLVDELARGKTLPVILRGS